MGMVYELKELWLDHVLWEIDQHKQTLMKSGVYTFARNVLSMVECREIPEPIVSVTKDGALLLDWKQPDGARLFLSFGSPVMFRHALIHSAPSVSGPLHVCRKDYADTIRGLFEEMFKVNSVQVEDYREGIS